MRRTWAPKGRTPVLRHPYRRGKQISMCGLVAYRPGQDDQDEPAAWMGFDLLEGAYDTRQFIRVLDGLGNQPWLELAYLPSYAPELDPVEGLWAN